MFIGGGGGGLCRHHLSDEPHGQNLLTLKFEMSHLIFCLHKTCIASETIQGTFFSVLIPDRMGAIKPRHHLWRWGIEGKERDRPPSFWWSSGSCSSEIVLTVSLSIPHDNQNFM